MQKNINFILLKITLIYKQNSTIIKSSFSMDQTDSFIYGINFNFQNKVSIYY